MSAGLIALMYHEIGVPGRATCHPEPGYLRYVVSAGGFRRQMQSLRRDDLAVTSVGRALNRKQRNSQRREIVLTFDDGAETDLMEAAPLLRELDFGATFYLTVGFLGQRGYLSRVQARELAAFGFEIGCHSFTHPYLPAVDSQKLIREVVHAKQELEQICGCAVEHFSCPGGGYNRRVREETRNAGYRSLATSHPRVNRADFDPFAFSRIAILRGTEQNTFQQIIHGKGLWRIGMKESARSAVRSLLGNSVYDHLRDALLERSS
jgi:peptidoglycan/xylan/chitin deacetylase (PgdA/CDA1 family)